MRTDVILRRDLSAPMTGAGARTPSYAVVAIMASLWSAASAASSPPQPILTAHAAKEYRVYPIVPPGWAAVDFIKLTEGGDVCGMVGDIQGAKMDLWGWPGIFRARRGRIEVYRKSGRLLVAAEMNEHGDIVGWMVSRKDSADAVERAFLLRAGQVLDIGLPAWIRSRAWGIDDRGRVVGTCSVREKGRIQEKLFVWNNGQQHTYSVGGEVGGRCGLSKNGVMAGSFYVNGGSPHCFAIVHGVAHDIGSPAAAPAVFVRMSRRGWIMGYSAEGKGPNRTFVYHDGAVFVLNGVGKVEGDCVNDQGQVAGEEVVIRNPSQRSSHRAFIWSRGSGIRYIGPIGEWQSPGNGINDSGDVVGGTDGRAWVVRRGRFLWLGRRGAGPGARPRLGMAINRSGTIAAESARGLMLLVPRAQGRSLP